VAEPGEVHPTRTGPPTSGWRATPAWCSSSDAASRLRPSRDSRWRGACGALQRASVCADQTPGGGRFDLGFREGARYLDPRARTRLAGSHGDCLSRAFPARRESLSATDQQLRALLRVVRPRAASQHAGSGHFGGAQASFDRAGSPSCGSRASVCALVPRDRVSIRPRADTARQWPREFHLTRGYGCRCRLQVKCRVLPADTAT